jgi:hypothetical protein
VASCHPSNPPATDPFTLSKVFRVDWLSGLEFEYSRFDFNAKFVYKLQRKGCSTLEIPVNHQSRSFQEGEKVRMESRPLTTLRALCEGSDASEAHWERTDGKRADRSGCGA